MTLECSSKCHLPESTHLSVIYLIHQKVWLQSSTGEIQPYNSPPPLSCPRKPICMWDTYANTLVLHAYMHAVHTLTHIPFQSLIPLWKYKQNSYCCQFKLNVCIWYSSGAAKCTTKRPVVGYLEGCTTVWSASSARQTAQRQNNPLLLMRTFFTSLGKVNIPSEC